MRGGMRRVSRQAVGSRRAPRVGVRSPGERLRTGRRTSQAAARPDPALRHTDQRVLGLGSRSGRFPTVLRSHPTAGPPTSPTRARTASRWWTPTAIRRWGPDQVGKTPCEVAITPDGRTAYVANEGSESVSVINTQTGETGRLTDQVGNDPETIAVAPDGKTAYVVNYGSESVSVIDTQAGKSVGSSWSECIHADCDHARRQNCICHQLRFGRRLRDRSPGARSGQPDDRSRRQPCLGRDQPRRQNRLRRRRRLGQASGDRHRSRQGPSPIQSGRTSDRSPSRPMAATAYVVNSLGTNNISVIDTQAESSSARRSPSPLRPRSRSSPTSRPMPPSPSARSPGSPARLQRRNLQRPRRDDRRLRLEPRRRADGDPAARPEPHLRLTRHLPGDPDPDRQRGMLDQLRLHRADRLLQREVGRDRHPAGRRSPTRGCVRVPQAGRVPRAADSSCRRWRAKAARGSGRRP